MGSGPRQPGFKSQGSQLALGPYASCFISLCQAFLFLELELKACFLSPRPEGAGPCRFPFNSNTPLQSLL